ncbi:MAG: hypothetical protein Phog2KO_41100 [Phototrophicaceae bacterium]
MLKRFIGIIVAISLIFVLSACNVVKGNGNVTDEVFELSDFSEIEFDGVGDVFIETGEVESVVIRTDENLQERMKAEVRGDTLYIGQQDGNNLMNPSEITFLITVTDLDSVVISGAGAVTIDGIEAETLALELNGATDTTLTDIDVDSLSIEISGAGGANASGQAQSLTVDISGVGEFSGFDLETDTAEINISGAGSAEVNVNDTLTGSINGVGDLSYRGNPSVDVEQNGLGDVSAED